MIPKDVHLYTWVDVEEVLQRSDWPEWLVWAQASWNSLTLSIRPGKRETALEWLAEKFTPRFDATSQDKCILLESVSGASRKSEVLFEETERASLRRRRIPGLTKPIALWPPREMEPVDPLPSDFPPVVAFHAAKGGVGRTLHAIALARALVEKDGKKSRVLLIDGDLESPGLTWLLRPFGSASISFRDFFTLVHSDPDPIVGENVKLVADRVRDVCLDGVYVLPAFRSERHLTSVEIKPWHFVQATKDPFILTWILANLGKLLDVQAVIVDLSAGISELSTWLLFDPRVYRVLVTTLSGQSIEGTRHLLQCLAEFTPARQKQGLLPTLILSQVPPKHQKGYRFLAPYKKMLSAAARPFLENEQEDSLPDLLYLTTYFDENLVILPNEWGEVTKMLSQSNLVEQMRPLADRLPHISLGNRTLFDSTDCTRQSKEDTHRMNTAEIKSMATEYIMNTYGDRSLAFVRGEGAYLWDADGKKYLDFLGGLAVNGLGHCHPNVVSAIREQAGQLLHVSNLYYIEPQAQLAKLLIDNCDLDQCFFCNSGAEANEAGIKLARKFTKDQGRTDAYEIITMDNSFHGRTMATITATAQTKYHKGFEPMVPGFTYVPFDDLSAVEDAISDKTCGILVEAIQSEGGVNTPSSGYLQGLRDLCDTHNLVLILDEVQTAMGRLGPFFGYQSYGVIPDIITMAKSLGGGTPIGAMLAKGHIAESFVPGTHAATFGGNPLVTAAACATVKTILDENLGENAVKMGDYLADKLMGLKDQYPIKEIRGKGLLRGLVLSVDANALAAKCIENGLITICTNDYVLRFLPPLNITAAHVDEAVSIVEQSLSETL